MISCENYKDGIIVGKRFAEFLKDFSGKPYKRMLEVGCGYGIASTYTHDLVNDLTLIDIDPFSVDYNEKKWHSDNKVHVFQTNINGTNGLFDVIYYFLSLHHIYDVPAELVGVKEKLSNDGLLFICEIYTLSDKIYHHKEYSPHDGFKPNELSKIISNSGFEIIDMKNLGTILRGNDSFFLYAIISKQQKRHI